jgi:lipoprotein-anchoring transpeptidase ErfK/SrfK
MSAVEPSRRVCTAALSSIFSIVFAGVFTGAASAQSLSYSYNSINRDGVAAYQYGGQAAPQTVMPGEDDFPAQFRRQVVIYPSSQPPGTVIIDTAHTFLYFTLGGGRALRYGIGVGRKGFTWSGVEAISRKSEWPDWIPPAEMIARQPYLPRWVGGGPGNPLGARALYLGNTDYRIHGTNNPGSIGKQVSSGCIRMRDADVIDLYNRVGVGTKVVVLPGNQHTAALDDGRSVTVERLPAGGMAAVVPIAVSSRLRVESGDNTASSSSVTSSGLY